MTKLEKHAYTKRFVEYMFYASIATIYIYTAYVESTPEMTALKEKYGSNGHKTFLGRFKYATFLNLMGQTFYFVLCASNSLAEMILLHIGLRFEENTKIRRFCNFFYTGLAFPAAGAVVVQFWTIYLIDRQSIYPRVLDKILPSWLNHAVHTLPLIACIMENIITKHTYNPSFLIGSLPTLCYSIGYLILTLIVIHYGGVWTYPFISRLNRTHFVVLTILSIGFNLFLYKCGELLNNLIWNTEVVELNDNYAKIAKITANEIDNKIDNKTQ